MMLYYPDRASCMWGEFDLGPWWGIVYMESGPSKFSDAKINLKWRANRHENHSPSFGPDCTGFLIFSSLGEIHGTLWASMETLLNLQGEDVQVQKRAALQRRLTILNHGGERLRRARDILMLKGGLVRKSSRSKVFSSQLSGPI